MTGRERDMDREVDQALAIANEGRRRTVQPPAHGHQAPGAGAGAAPTHAERGSRAQDSPRYVGWDPWGDQDERDVSRERSARDPWGETPDPWEGTRPRPGAPAGSYADGTVPGDIRRSRAADRSPERERQPDPGWDREPGREREAEAGAGPAAPAGRGGTQAAGRGTAGAQDDGCRSRVEERPPAPRSAPRLPAPEPMPDVSAPGSPEGRVPGERPADGQVAGGRAARRQVPDGCSADGRSPGGHAPHEPLTGPAPRAGTGTEAGARSGPGSGAGAGLRPGHGPEPGAPEAVGGSVAGPDGGPGGAAGRRTASGTVDATSDGTTTDGAAAGDDAAGAGAEAGSGDEGRTGDGGAAGRGLAGPGGTVPGRVEGRRGGAGGGGEGEGHGRGGPAGHAAVEWSAARDLAARAAVRAPTRPVLRPLAEALGQVLAAPLAALTDLPPFDTSAMDGWAVAGPGPWRVDTGEQGILAGHEAAAPLPDGHAVRIATGARIPPGATAVLRREHGAFDSIAGRRPEAGAETEAETEADAGGDRDGDRGGDRDGGEAGDGNVARGVGTGRGGARLLRAHRAHPVTQGQDIRPRGQECRTGDLLLPTGAPVTPAVLGLAAAAGYDELPTVPRPRVEVLVLGDELLTSGLPRDGRIRDALGPMIGPWLVALGAELMASRHVTDDAEALYEAVSGSPADLVITTGGTAAGPVDHVHPTLHRIGAELLVDGVAVRPGHPMLLARLAPGRHLVGLPGNPLAAVSGLLTLAEPLLRGLTGRAAPPPRRIPLAAPVSGHPRDTRLIPVTYRGDGGDGGDRGGRDHEGDRGGGRGGGRGHRGDRTGRNDRDAWDVWGASSGTGDRARRGRGAGSRAMAAVPLRFNGPAMLRGVAVADAVAVIPPGGARRGAEVRVLDLPWATWAAPSASSPEGGGPEVLGRTADPSPTAPSTGDTA